MMQRVAALDASIETLYRDPEARSRNRHFDRFRDPRDAYARRVALFLLDLRATLRRLPPEAVRVVPEPSGRVRVQYRDAVLGFSRIVFLTHRELGLLGEDAVVAERLGLGAMEAIS